VWAYLGKVENIAAWDRGVARAAVTSDASAGAALEFDTYARARGDDATGAWGKMSYRVAPADSSGESRVRLTSSTGNARFFRSAEWRFRVEPVPEGSRVFCTAEFILRRRYFFLAPVLRLMTSAIRRDLRLLKQKLEVTPSLTTDN